MAKINMEKYTNQQLDAAHLLANRDENGMTKAQIAEAVGISDRTLYRWCSADEEFLELLDYFSELSMQAFTAELYGHLKKSVRQGSTRGMELALKNRGKLIDKKEVSGSLDVNSSADKLSQDALMSEIEELKRKIQGNNANTPRLTAKESDD